MKGIKARRNGIRDADSKNYLPLSLMGFSFFYNCFKFQTFANQILLTNNVMM
jgi:hypothetical protein